MADLDEHCINEDQTVDFCTLAMFIIDEIHYPVPKQTVYDILGGAGTYSAIGARLFSAPPVSRTVSWVVDEGSDFPEQLKEVLRSWKTSCYFRSDPSRLTTRGWNSIDASEYRAFKYMTPKKRIDADALRGAPALIKAKSFHLICSPERCLDLVRSIGHLRRQQDRSLPRPIYIWEPVPDLCVPTELLNLTRVLPYIDVCSPNAAELGALLGYHLSEVETATGEVNPGFVETATEQLLSSMPLASFAIVVRAGKSGCYIGKNGGRSGRASCFESDEVIKLRDEQLRGREEKRRIKEKLKPRKHLKTLTSNTYATPTPKARPSHGAGGLTADTDMMALFAHVRLRQEESSDEEDSDTETEDDHAAISPDFGTSIWLPAYHTSGEKVVDPTGGGNAFLGGLSVGLARGVGLETACKWGSVAASFAIEQIGMPKLSGDENHESWNGVSVLGRLAEYESRMAPDIQMSNHT